jgi:hypothetical protein
MAYKVVGADENGHFPPRVQTALNATYATKNVVEKIDSAGTHTAATFAVRLDANGDVDALVLNGVDL